MPLYYKTRPGAVNPFARCCRTATGITKFVSPAAYASPASARAWPCSTACWPALTACRDTDAVILYCNIKACISALNKKGCENDVFTAPYFVFRQAKCGKTLLAHSLLYLAAKPTKHTNELPKIITHFVDLLAGICLSRTMPL